MSSGSRRNSSNPNVPSDRTKTSTQRSTAGVEGLAKTDQEGSKRDDTPIRISAVVARHLPRAAPTWFEVRRVRVAQILNRPVAGTTCRGSVDEDISGPDQPARN